MIPIPKTMKMIEIRITPFDALGSNPGSILLAIAAQDRGRGLISMT